METDRADTLDGRADDAAEVDKAAVHVGTDKGGLVRADTEDVAGVEDGFGAGLNAGVVLMFWIVEEVLSGLIVQIVIEVAPLVIQSGGNNKRRTFSGDEMLLSFGERNNTLTTSRSRTRNLIGKYGLY